MLAVLTAWATSHAAETPQRLWQIGREDNDNREFALAPQRYGEFRVDGCFAVGRSDAQRDWPYVHPGPADHWAGGRPHKFSVVFGLNRLPAEGPCVLRLDLIDTQGAIPPALRLEINGHAIKRQLPPGAGDASINGDPRRGKEHRLEIPFPVSLLKTGANEIALTTTAGSWFLYDWLGLDVPVGCELGEVTGTLVSSMHSPPMLVDAPGQPRQVVQVTLRHFGPATPVTVRVDDTVATNLTLSATTQSFEVAVPAAQAERTVKVAVEMNGQTLATQTLRLKKIRPWTVYLLPHSHVDIGYTHVQTEVEQAQWRYLEMAMETARQTAHHPPGARFKWNVEVLWAVDSYLAQATPEKREAFFAAVKAGQVGLDALYGNQLTGLCRPEELLRLLRFAAQLAQRTGVPIESAMITDVPGYTWGMVPAMAHSGVKYFSIGPNGGDRIGHTIAAWGDKPFWWIGPNERDRVLVWMTGTGYYQVFQSPERLLDYLGRLEEGGYPYDFVHVRHCLGDNGAPDVHFAAKVKAWNERYAYPRLVIATTAEMFRDFAQRYGDRLPTARGDFTPYWEDGAGSSARETALNRASAERLTQAEILFALRQPAAYPAKEFWQAWRNVLLYDEHTWGAHNSISQPDDPFVHSQWAIKQAFALDADRQSRALLNAALRGSDSTGAASAGETAASGPSVSTTAHNAIDVYNTLSWSQSHAPVTVPRELSTAGDVVRAGSLASATPLASQRLTSGELVFPACFGPFSGQRYYITAGQPGTLLHAGARASGATLETSTLELRVDETTGAIVSLRDKRSKLEWVNPEAPTALNDYFYLPGSDLKGLKRNGPVKITVKENGPLIASLLIESDAPGCRRLTREIRVLELAHRIDIINTVDKLPVRAKEGVHFGFGFQVPDGVVRMDVPWAVVRPETDQIRGACKNWFTVQRWVDVSNDRFGITWATLDAPLVQVGGVTANLIGSLSDPRAWLDRVEPSQTIYSWAMNNHWHTNYRAEQEGPTVFRYSLWPHRAFRVEEVTRFAVAMSQPLVVAPAQGAAVPAPEFSAPTEVVQITAYKPADDGQAYIVRLYNPTGQSERVPLAWKKMPKPRIWISDNSERAITPTQSPIEVPAHGLVTVRVERP